MRQQLILANISAYLACFRQVHVSWTLLPGMTLMAKPPWEHRGRLLFDTFCYLQILGLEDAAQQKAKCFCRSDRMINLNQWFRLGRTP